MSAGATVFQIQADGETEEKAEAKETTDASLWGEIGEWVGGWVGENWWLTADALLTWWWLLQRLHPHLNFG